MFKQDELCDSTKPSGCEMSRLYLLVDLRDEPRKIVSSHVVEEKGRTYS